MTLRYPAARLVKQTTGRRSSPLAFLVLRPIDFVDFRMPLLRGHPQFVWCGGSIRALSKFGPARPYIARFKVFNRLIWPSA